MPNWCMGVMEITGEKQNVINFMKNGLRPVTYMGDTALVQIIETDTSIELKRPKNTSSFYVEGSHRNFVDESTIRMELKGDDEIHELKLVGYMGAWSIESDALVEISGAYGIRMEIEADEPGMCFTQHIIVNNGELELDESGDYVDEYDDEYDDEDDSEDDEEIEAEDEDYDEIEAGYDDESDIDYEYVNGPQVGVKIENPF